MSACKSLPGNESYLVNTSQLNPQLLHCLLKSLTNESRLLLQLLSMAASCLRLTRSQSQSYVTTDSQSASLPWNKAPI
jgi:hypothetical protein